MFSYQPVIIIRIVEHVVDGLLLRPGLKREDFGGQITFAGMDPIRPTHLKVGCASATVSAANAIASAIIWKHRSGESQDIHIDCERLTCSEPLARLIGRLHAGQWQPQYDGVEMLENWVSHYSSHQGTVVSSF